MLLDARHLDARDGRHLLAAGAVARVEVLVTFNLRHFGADACDPQGVRVVHPDQFLVGLHDLDHETVEDEIGAQAAVLRRLRCRGRSSSACSNVRACPSSGVSSATNS